MNFIMDQSTRVVMLAIPKRSTKCLSKKVEVLNLVKKEKDYTLRMLRSTIRTRFMSIKLCRKKRNSC